MSRTADIVQGQLDVIVNLGYPKVADMSIRAFVALAQPLLAALDRIEIADDVLLVPTRELVSPDSLIARTSIRRNAGFSTMPSRDIESFVPVDFRPPEGPFYIVVNPHTGTKYVNREPDVARKLMDSDGFQPLALEEGIAIATQHPDWLVRKNGFNLLGSRSSDGRVPAIWMSQGSPRLSSIWPTSRHTWLGNAYCSGRKGEMLLS